MSDDPIKFRCISSVPNAYGGAVFAQYARTASTPLVYVAQSTKELEQFKQSLAFFAPDLTLLTLPDWDCLPYDRTSPRPEVQAQRLSTLYQLTKRGSQVLLGITPAALTQCLLPPETLTELVIELRANTRQDPTELANALQNLGYRAVPSVSEPGEFSSRGGLLDVYAPGTDRPVRLDFFGDTLETINQFDPLSQRRNQALDRLTILPASEVLLNDTSITQFRSNYRRAFGNVGHTDPLYESVSAGRMHQGMEHWMPLFGGALVTLFDYLPQAQMIGAYGILDALGKRLELIQHQYQARVDAAQRKAQIDVAYHPITPDQLYLSQEQIEQHLKAANLILLQPTPAPKSERVADYAMRMGRNFAAERASQSAQLFELFCEYITDLQREKPIYIASFSAGGRERMAGVLADYGVDSVITRDHFDPDLKQGQIALVVWALEEGFESDHLVVISEQDILGPRLLRQKRSRKRADNFLTEATSLKQGDLVVHIEHGIGRFAGLETVAAAGAPHDCVLLEYANNDRLYLPIENIDLLARYGQDSAVLDRLGGAGWQARKARLKQRLRDMAEKLLRIAAERALRQAVVIEPPSGNWDEFCARFPFTETDDQLNAIDDVLADLQSGRPMDRLICGDVGFGKTEVALRAAFAAAASGVQVAVIAPTTLLARQHYNAFAARFQNSDFKVQQLSRFVSAADAKLTKQALRDGHVDIVIGTHALLAKDVDFANLGLLIIDEEQKFGVAHKERLKQLRSDVHVLTLTATPIPRTLQMSLSGVRELSLIATPPVDRLAIRTYISEFDQITVREALLREHYRGGQSFFVVPRIADLSEVEDFLQAEVPEIPFVIAHGQLAAGDLDDRMNAFYDGKYSILLATTIVESGLDIPTANTIIIHKADQFGLAQLYQLRGRVGRSKTRAYAYLTTKPRKPLTPNAQKRLRVLSSLDSLGAGFTLASYDLDIRGAGNLLGDEQSGNIREVGYELYQSMLEDTIAKLKSGDMDGLSDAGRWAPQINLGVPVLIPTDYVADLDLRLGLYRRLSNLGKRIELDDFAAELIDRFGPLPQEVEWLLRVVRIKALCQRANVAKLDAGPKGAVLQFHNDQFADPQRLAQYLVDSRGTAKVKNNKLVVRRDWTSAKARVNGAYVIVRDLIAPRKGA